MLLTLRPNSIVVLYSLRENFDTLRGALSTGRGPGFNSRLGPFLLNHAMASEFRGRSEYDGFAQIRHFSRSRVLTSSVNLFRMSGKKRESNVLASIF